MRLVQRVSPWARYVRRWEETVQLRRKLRRSRLMLRTAGEQMPTARMALWDTVFFTEEEQLVNVTWMCSL